MFGLLLRALGALTSEGLTTFGRFIHQEKPSRSTIYFAVSESNESEGMKRGVG
jgi:hypothetical protein